MNITLQKMRVLGQNGYHRNGRMVVEKMMMGTELRIQLFTGTPKEKFPVLEFVVTADVFELLTKQVQS
jgi:hypothetical protein